MQSRDWHEIRSNTRTILQALSDTTGDSEDLTCRSSVRDTSVARHSGTSLTLMQEEAKKNACLARRLCGFAARFFWPRTKECLSHVHVIDGASNVVGKRVC
jgi:hypothetical protein